ncbi:hypothetical protein BC936DRAFT_138161 [Jimgerdemannia flammicorona]|uniref:Uncharacterized protein n=2 Tax=Jimgerdemannia flammicorona TaxID=994334 RepID=A0A433Q9I3_9FUNG|nr:hypothetical protein BC936DRAFT_138161 [Jimgerdemannia flammicorona]RUS26445.1 hypothetical protein BC938DRAFT_470762 [Jimgerdemannia flammicorona]
MIVEITQAVDFLGRLLSNKVASEALVVFKTNLTNVLQDRFAGHWDVNRPYFGNGFRAISCFNGVMDPILVKAAQMSTLTPATLYAHLPRDFVLWIDPYSVSYRVGDHGNINTLFEDRSRGSSRITFKLDANSPAVSSIHEIVHTASPTLSPLAPIFTPPRVHRPVRITPPPSPPSKKGQQLVMAN